MAVATILLAACTDRAGDSSDPTCASAMWNLYDNGCRYHDAADRHEAVTVCTGEGELAVEAGCSEVFRAMIECLDRLPGDCRDCDDEIDLLHACLDPSAPVCAGYPGQYTGCCRPDDPCAWSDNGSCDCNATCGWDTADCGLLVFDGVDILVVVDNSTRTIEDQVKLAAAFPGLIQSLLDPAAGHEAVLDLHIGVVSTDMGTGGYPVETCRNPIDGDNGELLNAPNPAVAVCDSAYPKYLMYDCTWDPPCPDVDEIDWISTGFGCIATLGEDGCGFVQHLKAASKALIENRDGPNAGFLRDSSLLVIVFLSDRDDCSVAAGNERFFDVLATDLGHFGIMRCFNHPGMLEGMDSYINDFRSLRADPEKLVLAFFVGVPQDPACEGRGDEIPDCLNLVEMTETVDPVEPTHLLPSCESTDTVAFPPRRFVTMAQAFGDRALVRSICDTDFTPAVQALTERIHAAFDG